MSVSLSGHYVHIFSRHWCEVEVCMGLGVPMGVGLPWDSHRNGNWI